MPKSLPDVPKQLQHRLEAMVEREARKFWTQVVRRAEKARRRRGRGARQNLHRSVTHERVDNRA